MKVQPFNQNYTYKSSDSRKAQTFGAVIPPAAVEKESKVINSILKNKAAQWAFKFANDNPFGFSVLTLATTCMVFRPATVMALPGQKKEDKQYLAVKSFVASAVANAGRLMFILPLGIAIKKMGEAAKKDSGFKFPHIETKNFNAFNFATNNGFAILLSIGTAAVMTKAIPKVMSKILPPPESKKQEKNPQTKITPDKKGGAL